MKKLLVLVFVLLPIAAQAVEPINLARGFNPYVAGAGVAAAACGSLGNYDDGASSFNFGKTTGAKHIALEFVPSAGTIHEVRVMLKDAGTPTEVITLKICTSDGQETPAPTTTCTEADNTLAGTGHLPGGTFVWVAAEFAAGYAVSAQSYFIVVGTAQNDDANYYALAYTTSGSNQISGSADGTTWTSSDTTAQGNYRITSCTDWE